MPPVQIGQAEDMPESIDSLASKASTIAQYANAHSEDIEREFSTRSIRELEELAQASRDADAYHRNGLEWGARVRALIADRLRDAANGVNPELLAVAEVHSSGESFLGARRG